MWNLRGTVQCYGWGSPRTIPDFLGIRPDGRPYAELWYGAHPGGPSTALPTAPLLAGRPPAIARLDELVASDASTVLGRRVRETFGGRMPFLVKLLAADKPLSLQAHPDAATARAGFAREVALRVPSARRNYADDQHKPETVVALAEMRALAGFRPPLDVAMDLERLGSRDLAPVVAALRGPGAPADVTRAAFELVLRLPSDELGNALAALSSGVATAGSGVWGSDALEVARELAEAFPGDPGALAATFLHALELHPGQALSVGAGVVHCYVRGFGLEIMASSDNVLRAGLTTKLVDVDELLAVLDFEPQPANVRSPMVTRPQPGVCVEHFDLPFAEYALDVVDVVDVEPAFRRHGSVGPRLILGLAGAVTATTPTGRSALAPGGAVLLADGEEVDLAGRGRVAVVGVPQPW